MRSCFYRTFTVQFLLRSLTNKEEANGRCELLK